MKSLLAAIAFAVIAATMPLSALAGERDGQLPLYPHGTPAPGMGDIPANALAAGVPYQQTTTDSIPTVDAWYRTNASKGCSRIQGSGAVQYKCPGGSIVIQTHGTTLISFVPAFQHF